MWSKQKESQEIMKDTAVLPEADFGTLTKPPRQRGECEVRVCGATATDEVQLNGKEYGATMSFRVCKEHQDVLRRKCQEQDAETKLAYLRTLDIL